MTEQKIKTTIRAMQSLIDDAEVNAEESNKIIQGAKKIIIYMQKHCHHDFDTSTIITTHERLSVCKICNYTKHE